MVSAKNSPDVGSHVSFPNAASKVAHGAAVDQLSRTAARTRRHIVATAIACWARDSAASLSHIARVGQVGRTTLNRYFGSREALIAEVDRVARERFVGALQEVPVGDETGSQSLVAVAAALMEISDVLGLLFTDTPVIDLESWEDPIDADGHQETNPIHRAISRGHADGSINRDLPVEWVETLLWSVLLSAQQMLTAHHPRHRVVRWVEQSLTGAIAPR